MAINVSDLPPKYQAQAMKKYMEQQKRRGPCDSWRYVVEDVKSKATRTAKYAMKKKMLKDRFGYDITEV